MMMKFELLSPIPSLAQSVAVSRYLLINRQPRAINFSPFDTEVLFTELLFLNNTLCKTLVFALHHNRQRNIHFFRGVSNFEVLLDHF